MNTLVGHSRFWSNLWRDYRHSPSIALCRVPELEYASAVDVGCRVLDHGCGDGRFAALAWPGRTITAGCDIDERALERARQRGHYQSLEVCDAASALPFADKSFDLVFNNSALEHIADLDKALSEIARILKPGGTLAFNALNHRYFRWWPLDDASRDHYRQIQPFYHALSAARWTQRLARVGLAVTEVQGYFDRKASRCLALLDYHFSSAHLANRRSLLVTAYEQASPLARAYWRHRLSRLVWRVEADRAAGYFVKAVRNNG